MRSKAAAALLAAGMLGASIPAKSTAGEPQIESRHTESAKNLADVARKYLDTPYMWGGRNTERNPGMDCLGLVFAAIEAKHGISWRTWSVKPSRLISQLESKGERKTFLTPEGSEPSAAIASLAKGDVILFLYPAKLKDQPVAKDSSGRDLYVWHTAVYSGDGKMVHASPFHDREGREVYRVFEEGMAGFISRLKFAGFVAVTYRGN